MLKKRTYRNSFSSLLHTKNDSVERFVFGDNEKHKKSIYYNLYTLEDDEEENESEEWTGVIRTV